MARNQTDPDLDLREVASLAALRRLTFGAAHSLNNAFTSALGEATFLLDEHKDDPELVECCQMILQALDRSTRITRGLLARRRTSAGEEEADLGRVLSELTGLLRETLGSGHVLDLTLPREWVGVKGDPIDLDLILTTLFQYAADATGEQSRLGVVLDRDEETARMTLTVTDRQLPDGVVEAINDPDLASDAVTRACLDTARDLVGSLGGSLHADRTAPDSWALVLVLPTI